jgi:hypothetical protein
MVLIEASGKSAEWAQTAAGQQTELDENKCQQTIM